jgi:hypothetical protein
MIPIAMVFFALVCYRKIQMSARIKQYSLKEREWRHIAEESREQELRAVQALEKARIVGSSPGEQAELIWNLKMWREMVQMSDGYVKENSLRKQRLLNDSDLK